MMNNKSFTRKIFTVFTVLFVLTCFMSTGLWAAKKVELYSHNAKKFIKDMNKDGKKAGEAFGLGNGDDFKLIKQRKDFNNITHFRYQQTYMDIPVWGYQTMISKDKAGNVRSIHGNFVLNIAGDVKGVPKTGLDPQAALAALKEDHKKKDANAKWSFDNEEAGVYIYIDKKGKAYLAYVVSFFADTEAGNPSQPIFFVNAKTGKIIDSYNMLRDADGYGPGGNVKIGQYYYGTDFPPFGVTQAGSTCTMETTDVKTVNLNHGTSGSTAYSFTCPENTVKEINGAYSPLNDAQFFGQVVYDMYVGWYGVPPLTFQLMMRVHYSTNYENAFWNGSSMTFGDGYTTFYPLVCLDVTAHEVSHGFTEQNSNLIYSGESGGINEAFSDMAGEAAEYFSRGSCDYMCGFDIFKDPTGALRYLYDPPLDGISIDHVDDYYSGLNVHYSSGIFNKAFYLIATAPGWDTRMAFDIFVKANQDYWTASTNFVQGAEGVMNAAVDYGYTCQDVVSAFAQVGINLVCPGPPVADFSATPLTGGYPLTVYFTDASQAASAWSWNFGDGNTSTEQNPTHVYTGAGVYTVSLTVTNQFGSDILTKTNYITVTLPQPPVADFVASNTDIVQYDTVTFTDLTTENPVSWQWTFEGGTPATSTAQNPTVQYNTVGTYTVTLTATNPQGTDTETKIGYINVADKPYCASQGTTFSLEWVARVQVDDLDNASGSAGYSDFTNITENLTGGSTVNVTLTPGFSSTVYTEYWKIWIDYNNDHDFDDAGEEVFSGVGSSSVSGSFTVTPGINTVTRMRVSMKWNAYPTPCETFSYGEVEDYTVNISSSGNVPPVADFTFAATDLAVNFTDASTDSDGNIASWAWDFGDSGTSSAQNPTHTYASGGTYNVTLTVTDNDGATDSVTKPVTVTAPGTEMYVYNIVQTISKKGKNYQSEAVVTIWDTTNAPVANATVYISWSGVISGSANGVTDANGNVTFQSDKVKSTGPFIITVDNVTGPYTYNPALNIETTDSQNY